MGKRALLDETRAQADYEDGTDSLAVLAARHRVSRSTFYSRAKEGGWTRKHKVIRRSSRSKAEMEAARLEDAKRLLSASLTGRLLLAIDRKIEEIEKRMNGQAEAAAPQSAADIERDARSLNTLMQAYARVKELDAQARWDGKRSDQDSAKGLVGAGARGRLLDREREARGGRLRRARRWGYAFDRAAALSGPRVGGAWLPC